MVDIRNIELAKEAKNKTLLKYGFKKTGKDEFTIYKDLYKSIILLKFTVNLEEREIEYEVFDKNTGRIYFPFINNINGKNNLVALKIIDEFNEFIDGLTENRILSKREEER